MGNKNFMDMTHGPVGENDNSFGVLLEKNGTRIFLAGDMDDLSGDETLTGIIKICRHSRIYLTGCERGMLAVVGDNGQIDCYGHICDWKTRNHPV